MGGHPSGLIADGVLGKRQPTKRIGNANKSVDSDAEAVGWVEIPTVGVHVPPEDGGADIVNCDVKMLEGACDPLGRQAVFEPSVEHEPGREDPLDDAVQ